jgi:hypothetical protein
MSAHGFSNFSDLYRAAFAERNPEVKQLLLADVKRVLDQWANSVGDTAPPARPGPSQVSSSTITRAFHAA